MLSGKEDVEDLEEDSVIRPKKTLMAKLLPLTALTETVGGVRVIRSSILPSIRLCMLDCR